MVRPRQNPPGSNNPSSPSSPGGQPIRTATGQPYGQASQLADAQRTQPLPTSTTVGVGPAAATPAAAVDPITAARNFRPPQVGLGAPTARPGESVTQGLGTPLGAATGPPPVDPDILAIARYLPLLETRASMPGASMSMRALVLRLRGSLPPDFSFNQ